MSFRTGWSWLLGGVLTCAVLAPALTAKDIVTTVIPAGFVGLTPGVVALMVWIFQILLWTGLIAVPRAIVMAVVAARVTGETDVTSTKALGPVTQMLSGAVTPGTPSG